MAGARSVGATGGAWLYGRSLDLLVGAGAAYLLSIPILLLAAPTLGAPYWPPAVVVGLALVLNTPHYGATLLRVYEEREDRHRYAWIATWGTLGLAALLASGLHVAWLGSLLITVYLSWSPWHFSGQNYGVALTFLRRRGISVDTPTKRLLYASFILSFALAFVAMHIDASTSSYAPTPADARAGSFETLRLDIPRGPGAALAGALGLAYLATTAGAALGLRRAAEVADASRRALFAPALLVLTQSMWFAIPAAGELVGRPLVSLPFAALWISIAHSAQYLWITTYYAQRRHPGERAAGHYLKALSAGSLLIGGVGVVALVVQPSLTWNGGTALVLFSVVNLHHFILDGAVWKLRDGRVSRILLRTAGAAPASGATASSRSRTQGAVWTRRVVWTLGALCACLSLVEAHAMWALESPELERSERAARELDWIARQSPALLAQLGDQQVAAGRLADAAGTWEQGLGIVRAPTFLNNLAWTLATDPRSSASDRARAVSLAEEANAVQGGLDVDVLDTLAVAYAAVGRTREAAATAEAAAARARRIGYTQKQAALDARARELRAAAGAAP